MKKKKNNLVFITVRLLASTRDSLADFGKKSETFDDIIVRLLDNYKPKKGV